MKLDWKFGLMLLIAIAGVIVPVWLWQADQNSKSISIRLVTRIALQSKVHDSIAGVEVLVGGIRLEKPHLVIFEISNTGNKPIPAADFESPIRIQLMSESTIARASISNKTPKDIEATLIPEQKAVSLKLALLNPGDIILINTITTGELPVFEIATRIVGISKVILEDSSVSKTKNLKLALLLFGAILSQICFSLISDVMIKPDGIFF